AAAPAQPLAGRPLRPVRHAPLQAGDRRHGPRPDRLPGGQLLRGARDRRDGGGGRRGRPHARAPRAPRLAGQRGGRAGRDGHRGLHRAAHGHGGGLLLAQGRPERRLRRRLPDLRARPPAADRLPRPGLLPLAERLRPRRPRAPGIHGRLARVGRAVRRAGGHLHRAHPRRQGGVARRRRPRPRLAGLRGDDLLLLPLRELVAQAARGARPGRLGRRGREPRAGLPAARAAASGV
ncbi:MAG: hypothetical protein AVDCRST_MAG30-2512, partial [uncultured Solirubrobacteraceae bacterium]